MFTSTLKNLHRVLCFYAARRLFTNVGFWLYRQNMLAFHFIDSKHVAIPVYTRLFSIKSAAKHLASCTWGISLQTLFKCPTLAIVFGNATKPPRFAHFWQRCTIPCACHAKRALNVQKWSGHGVFCTFWLRNVLRATTACTFSTSQLPKVVRTWCVLSILASKCASRHNGVHFFDISTSKSGPRMVCFVHFDLEMCFAPQRRALFRHLTFPKWSDNGVFCTFWLGNVLRATTVCNFSSLIWPSWLRIRRFSEPTFRPSGATNQWKNTLFRDFPTFSRICIFFLLTLSLLLFSLLIFFFSLPLPCSAFHLSVLSEVWLLNFLR